MLKKVSRGEKDAFEVMYERFHPRIYRFVFRVLNSHEFSEEAVADTLYAVWNQASSFQEKSAVSTWIFGIAYRTSLKILDKNKRHFHQREPESRLDELEDSNPTSNPEKITEQTVDLQQCNALSLTSAQNI